MHDNQCPVGGPGDPTADCAVAGARRRRQQQSWRAGGPVQQLLSSGRRKAGSATGGAAASDAGEEGGEAGGDGDAETDALTIDDFMGIYVLLACISVVSLVWATLDKRLKCSAGGGQGSAKEGAEAGCCENAECQAPLTDPASVMRCGRCGEAAYCCVDCQTRSVVVNLAPISRLDCCWRAAPGPPALLPPLLRL